MLGIETMAIGMDTVDSEKAPSCPLSSPALLSHESKESYFMWICLLSFRCSFLLSVFLPFFLYFLPFLCSFYLSFFIIFLRLLWLMSLFSCLFLSFLIFSIPSSASSSLLLFPSLFRLWESLGVKRIRWERRRIGYNSCSKVVKKIKECSDFVDKWTKEKSSGKSSSKYTWNHSGNQDHAAPFQGHDIILEQVYAYIYIFIDNYIYLLFIYVYLFIWESNGAT